MSPKRPCVAATLALLLAAGCGGGGAAFQSTTGGAPGGSAGATISWAIVTADVDGDGQADVLQVPLGTDGADAPRCWQGDGHGGLVPSADPAALPWVDAIRQDLRGRSEQEILDDEGAHQAALGVQHLPYAVMHLEAGDDAPDPDATPVLDALRPTAARPGALVGLQGSDLAARDQATAVTFDGIEARVLLALPRFVLAVVPELAPLGTVPVVVTRDLHASAPLDFEVLTAPTPRVDEVRPDPLVPGVLAVVAGEHLGTPLDDVQVTFAGVAAERVLPLGRLLFVEVPAGAVSGLLVVTVGGVPSAGFAVEVADALDAPSLTGVTPDAASPGSLVLLEGDDLFVVGQRPRVHFGDAEALVFGRLRDGILAVVPDGAGSEVTIQVGGRTSGALAFEVLERGAPVIDALAPDEGKPGDLVVIEGRDLYDLRAALGESGPGGLPLHLPRVTFGDRTAFFVLPTERGLLVAVPFGLAAGEVEVVVEQDGTASPPATFTVR